MFCPQCRNDYCAEYHECPECKVRLVARLPSDSVEDAFVSIARFDTRLEAEAIGHALDQYDIPFLVKSDDIGIFGPGHVMSTPQGASLWVPASRKEEVAELLSCVVETDPEPPEELPDS